MTTEDYVPKDIAILLNEKGFYGDCCQRYSLVDVREWQADAWVDIKKGERYFSEGKIDIEQSVQCPTLQMARKWLSEAHNIFISISIGYVGRESRKTYMWMPCVCKSDHIEYPTEEDFEAPSEEEAIVDALRYCLEHLI